MSEADTLDEATPPQTEDDLNRLGRVWIDRIRAAEKREDQWMKDAENAETAYLCDEETDSDGTIPDFNILHSNVETIVPSIYNSTPAPEVRPRHFQKDEVARLVGDIYERCISVQIDDNKLDTEIEAGAQDAFMAGRDVVRVRFDADDGDDGQLTNERVLYEVVSWRDYREGPAKRWDDVPWVAYRFCLPQEEIERLQDDELKELLGGVFPAGEATGEEKDVEGWEIWDKDNRRVLFVLDASNRVLSLRDDPLGLPGFFPQPMPVQPITGTGKRTPVCPYKVYRVLAEELDTQTRRINKITTGLKVRGAFAGDAQITEAMRDAVDNEIVSIPNIENLAATGGLDKAIMWWPIDVAVAVLRELHAQRDQTKQAIYEITGISDIIRGQGKASETATAQQIKTEWGSLRIKKMQRLIERQVRDLFVLTAEIISRQFSIPTMQRMAGIDIRAEAERLGVDPQQIMQLLQSPLDHMRVDVESDSTVRADTSKGKQEMSEFLRGTAEFFSAMGPVVAQAPQTAAPLAQMYASFARQFRLGRQAEDALEEFAEIARQTAEAPPPPNPEAEAKQAEMQLKAQELDLKAQESQGRMQAEGQKLGFEAQKAQAELQEAQVDREIKGVELRIKLAELRLKEAESGVKQADLALKGEAQTADIGLKRDQMDLSEAEAEFDAAARVREMDATERENERRAKQPEKANQG